MARNSACAEGSSSSSRLLWARAMIVPSCTTTAPIGTSPTSAAARASASASRMKRSSSSRDTAGLGISSAGFIPATPYLSHRAGKPRARHIAFDAIITQRAGEMAERLNAAVLKTVEHASVPRGSNPSLSARLIAEAGLNGSLFCWPHRDSNPQGSGAEETRSVFPAKPAIAAGAQRAEGGQAARRIPLLRQVD